MKKVFGFIKDILSTLLIAFTLSFLIVKFILYPCIVDGRSMEPTLQDKDYGFSFIIKKNIDIKRFDICVLNVNNDDKLIVKRVIGLPFDTIEYKDNKLYINGEYYEEKYLGEVTTDDFSYSLKENEYFCLGDNRDISKDSRYYGPFAKEDFRSTGMLVIYPFKDFGVKK